MIYLYVKTHNKTGLKYLGKTTAPDPHRYRGSGKYWKLHLKKYGYDCSTQILFESTDSNEIKKKGIYFSKKWDIINSDQWANLKEEQGDGGATVHTPESNKKRSDTMKGRIFSDEHRKKLSEVGKGRGDIRTKEGIELFRQKASIALKGKKKPPGFGEKIRKIRIGMKFNDSAKQNMRLSWTPERKKERAERTRLQNLNRPILTCPHCGKQGKANMYRYHFDNCSKCLQ